MKENMVHFQAKIAEMQRKLNMINENIEEIKSGRTSLEEAKCNKIYDFLKNNKKKKNCLKMNNNNSINYFNRKNGINSEFNSISNKPRKNLYHYKNSCSNINVMNNNYNEFPKKCGFINSKLNINNDRKYMNYQIENRKDDTPTLLRNTTNYKNNKICINNNYSNERLSNNNKCINNRRIKKVNSTSEILTSISAIKSHKRLKKYILDKTNKSKENIDIDYNYSYNTEKINHNKNASNKHKSKSLSIENQRRRHILNKGYYSYNNSSIKQKRNSNTIDTIEHTSLSNERNYIIKTKNKNNIYKKILCDIINATNEYNKNENKINIDNIFDEYKLLLYNNKIKNEFIFKIINLFNKHNKYKLDINNIEHLEVAWNWLKLKCDNKKEKENDEYKKLCLIIMKKYNLENIEQLKVFIMKMIKKVYNNDYFLEGIKKILLP